MTWAVWGVHFNAATTRPVNWDVQDELEASPDQQATSHEGFGRFERLPTKHRLDSGRLHGGSAPDMECLAKGKTHKPYELGGKADAVGTRPAIL